VSPIDDRLREDLSALLDGALPAERAAELRRRIEADPELRREYGELERAVARVRALPRAGAPPELRARLRRSLGDGRPRAPVFRLAWVAVAATVLLATGLALYLRREAPATFEAKREPVPRDATAGKDDFAAPQEAVEEAAPASEAVADAKTPDRAGREAKGGRGEPRLGASKRTKEQAAEVDLVRVVETAKNVGPADRKTYLRQLGALDPAAAWKHIAGLAGAGADGEWNRREADASARGAPPVLASILLADGEEAALVSRILSSARAADETASSVNLEAAMKDELATHVEGTPQELARLGQWLALLDLAADPARPKVTLFAEEKLEAQKKAAARVRALVRLRYGAPPAAKPQETKPASGK
jgi:hypothetical protein